MPATPDPVGNNGPYGPHWNAIIGGIRAAQQQANANRAGALNMNIPDLYGNTTMIIGQITGQVITIGAAYQQPGVRVQTPVFNFAVNDTRLHPTTGIMAVNTIMFGTINLTAGSNSATCTVTSPSAFVNWGPPAPTIGAANVSDPSTGIATPAIPYGTTATTTGGSYPNYTLTLSQNAEESGSGLYFTACTFDTFT